MLFLIFSSTVSVLKNYLYVISHTSQLFEIEMRDTYLKKYVGIRHTPCHAPLKENYMNVEGCPSEWHGGEKQN